MSRHLDRRHPHRRHPGLLQRIGTIVLTVMLVPVVSAAQGARLVMPDLSQLSKKASDTVDISLDTTLLGIASQFMSDRDGQERTIKELLQSLKAVYVRSFEFDADEAYTNADVEAVRRQLSAPGWNRLVGVRSRRDRADVDVYVWMDGNKPGGLAILAAEPRELTIVNIIGSIDLEKLRSLEGAFGIPHLDLERDRDRRKPKDDQ
jgi:hypothetical protein